MTVDALNAGSSRAEELRPEKQQPQHAVIADAIRRSIALGKYAPGERFPPERELAEVLGVGRMTLRAAMQLLNKEGFVRTTRGRNGGTVVQEHRKGSNRRAAAKEALRQIDENYEFRLALEPVAAAFAADRASAAAREAIVRLATTQPTSLAEYRALDSRFHLAIGDASDSAIFRDAIQRARTEFFLWADVLWVVNQDLSDAQDEAAHQHVVIAQAIQKADAREASEQMRLHLQWSRASFVAEVSP